MQNSSFATQPASSRFHRLGGPIGGVASGLGRTIGVDTGIVRFGLAAAVVFFGPTVVALYVALWLIMPIDESVPIEQRPDAPPISLLIILALIFGLGFLFDMVLGVASLFTSVIPVTWILFGAVALFLIWKKKS